GLNHLRGTSSAFRFLIPRPIASLGIPWWSRPSPPSRNCLRVKLKRPSRNAYPRISMADVHDKATRSKNMRAIATRDTAIEKRLASLLTEQGLVHRPQDAALPCRPDFVVDEYRCVIFTHGCFWHHHHCYLFKVPATRTAFWMEKIGKNVERDRRDILRLQELGWRVLIVWECALRGREK